MAQKGVKRDYTTRLDKDWLREYIEPHLVVDGDKKCWLWQNSNGNFERYPARNIEGVRYRIPALMLWIEGITEEPLVGDRSIMLCHYCDRGPDGCVRPDHIFIGDQFANMQDCVAKGRHFMASREFCVNGHPLNDELVGRRYQNTPNHRDCLVCKRESERRLRGIPEDKWRGSWVEKMAITPEQLLEALDVCKGYKNDAAKLLGISNSSFFRKWHQSGFDTNVPGTRKRPIRYEREKVTHCIRGHEFTPENTYITTDGRRGCRACQKAWGDERNRPRREARQKKNEELRVAMTAWRVKNGVGGNRSEGARIVGIPRTSFERKWIEFFG